jgi:phosphate transport system protein
MGCTLDAELSLAFQELKMVSQPKRREIGSKQELIRLSLQACLIAKDAAQNLSDGLATGSSMSWLAVAECEKELDQIDQYIDERIANAMIDAGEKEIRELLACLKFTIDLERIGDLIQAIVTQLRNRSDQLPSTDVKDLVTMATVLESMLDGIYDSYCARDAEAALSILRMDAEIDRHRNLIFLRYLEGAQQEAGPEAINIILITQCLERAGDHAKNLAEEVCHLVEGRSVRHSFSTADPELPPPSRSKLRFRHGRRHSALKPLSNLS